jgi:ABC-2 type transport system ATP-binding protein
MSSPPPGQDDGSIEGRAPRATATGQVDGPVLAVRDVAKSFRRGLGPRRRTIEVLRGASMEARPGELIGLVGENGSGKSTLLKIVVAMLDRDSGEIERRGRLGYCPQVPLLWGKLTVREHFELFAGAYELDSAQLTRARDRLVDELQFERYLDYRVEELSGGTRQKLNLALSLVHDPDLLLLDEPYSGFDWETYLRFWEMSARLRDGGMAIVVVSHLISERERLDRAYELRDGRLEEA